MFLIIYSPFNGYGREGGGHWKLQYKIVSDDIKLIEREKTKDLMVKVRLFELYTEKHRLIDKKEKELEIFGGVKSVRQVKSFKRIKIKILQKIENLSDKITNFIRDRNILGKLHYFKALSYDLENKKKLYYENLKKAESYIVDTQYKRQILNRLSGHYYNGKKFKDAERFYLKLVKLPPDRWLTKHYFNLSWVYFQQKKIEKAIRLLAKVYKISDNKKYHELGAQLDRTIILFYASSGKVMAGLKFLRLNKINTFQTLILFLRYNFENGDKKKNRYIMDELDRIEKSITERAILFTKSIEIWRSEKRFSLVYKKALKFMKKKSQFNEIRSKEKKNLLTDLKNYTGFLQVLLKSKNMSSEKKKIRLLRYILYNFDLLKVLNPEKNIEYNYLKGESSLSVKKYKVALSFYKRAIATYSKKKIKEFKRISPVYESLFFCLERLEKDKDYISNLAWTYQTYLKLNPKGNLSKTLYQKYIALSFKLGDVNKVFKLIKKYNKFFPGESHSQKKYFQELIRRYVKKHETKPLLKLRKLIKKGYLGFGIDEFKKITITINELYFKKFDQLSRSGDFKGAIRGFKRIAENKKNDYLLRIDSLIKVLKISHDQKMFISLSENLKTFLKVSNSKTLEKNRKKITYYVSLLCNKNMYKACYQHTLFLNKRLPESLSGYLLEKLFKQSLVNGKYLYASKLLKRERSLTPYFEQSLYLLDEKEMFSVLEKINDQVTLNKISKGLTQVAWSYMFLSSGKEEFDKFKQRTSKIKLFVKVMAEIDKQFEMIDGKVKNKPVLKIPQPLSFDSFSNYLENVLTENKKMNDNTDKLIKRINPYLTFYTFSSVIKYYKNLINYFEKFKASSEDIKLNQAIESEIKKLSLIYNKKIEDYLRLKKHMVNKIKDRTGAMKLFYEKTPLSIEVDIFLKSLLWK